MSIKGVDFPLQLVTPVDAGILQAAIMTDGILSGCEVTWSGLTVTIAPGMMIACGRRIKLTEPVSITLNAYVGYARIYVQIDASAASTKEAFEQVSFGARYASTPAGFVSGESGDINGTGVLYDAPIVDMQTTAAAVVGQVCRYMAHVRVASALWETADETAAFPAQTVFLSDVNLLDYNAYYARFINDGRYYDFWVSRGDITSGTITAEANRTTTDGDYNYIYSHAREWKIDLDNNAFVFGAGAGGYVGYAYGTSWSDNAMKPVAIYGCNL